MATTEFDEVTRPRGYNSHPSGVQAIEVARYFPGNLFNAFKYVFRAGLKDPSKIEQDLDKALWYLNDEFMYLPSQPMQLIARNHISVLMEQILAVDKGNRGQALRAIHLAAVDPQDAQRIEFAIAKVKVLKSKVKEYHLR